jgi:uncharacterized repeat protein (TIGR01451 family)
LKEVPDQASLTNNQLFIIDVRRFGVVTKGAQFFMKLFVDWLPRRQAVTAAFGFVLVASSAWGVDGPPVIVLEPESQSVASGATVSFEAAATGAEPLSYQWTYNGTNLVGRTNTILTLTNAQPRHWGNYAMIAANAMGSATSSVATLMVDADLVFRILGLQTNGAVAVEHEAFTGDDRGGIAVSAASVFVTGDESTGRFPLDNLGAGTRLGRIFDALVSNLRTETVYSLGNGASPIQYQGSTLSANSVNSLLEIDGVTGQLTGRRIDLSTNISLSTGSGIFAGYDRVVIYSGANSRVFNIALPSGVVSDLGSIGFLNRQGSESWAFWGVAEYFNGAVHLLNVQGVSDASNFGAAIVRTRVPERTATTLLGPFPSPGLNDMASFTFSLSRSRWIFHVEFNNLFRSPASNPDETLGSAKASFTTEAGYPAIVMEPADLVSYPSSNVTFRVVAVGNEPLAYQWHFNDSPIPGANEATIVLSNIDSNAMGLYSVEVSNPLGVIVSRAALLTVYSLPQVVSQPRSLSAFPGSNVFFSVSINAAPPFEYQWRFNGALLAGATNSFLLLTNVQPSLNGFYSVVVSNRFGSVLSSNAELNVVVPVDDGSVFQITSLTTNGLRSADVYEVLDFDLARGPLAVSSSQVFYSDFNNTARSSASDLSGGVELTTLYVALASNLRTEAVYALGDGTGPLGYSGGTGNRLWEVNAASGALTGARINLSLPISLPPFGSQVGFFSGYDRIVLLTGSRAYNITLPSGRVTDLGPMTTPSHAFSDSGAFWGIAEHAGGILYLVYARNDSRNIARTRVPDGVTTNFVTFSSLPFRMASITASIGRGRWYYQYNFSGGVFGNGTVNIGFASATFAIQPGFAADHFDWDLIYPLQSVGAPLSVTLTARTAANAVATSYDGTVAIAGLNSPAGTAVPVSPGTASGFANGVWTGQVTVLQASTAMVLRAFDASGITGTSSVFSVSPPNDMAVLVTDQPDPVLIGNLLTYTIVVTNTGPDDATAVTLTNLLPANFAFVSVASSIGACILEGRAVDCSLGTVSVGTVANVTITGIPGATGTLTNQTIVSRGEPDAVPVNNIVVTRTSVVLPSLAVDDVTTLEGNSGTNQVLFTVRLSAPSTSAVTVNYQTQNNSASGTGGLADYVPASGIVVFPPGTTNQTITVGIRGDPYFELNEVFLVLLSSPTNATIADGQASCTIQNDDPVPIVSVADVSVAEGNSGITNAIFPVRLSAIPALAVFVTYSTVGGSAQPGTDFIATNGFITFPPGNPQLTRNITVPVRGDTNIETTETFRLLLTPTNAITVSTQAVCTILNDDGQGVLHHFAWSSIAAVQSLDTPFEVSLAAEDVFNSLMTNFTGTVSLSAGTGAAPTNIFGGAAFTNSGTGDFTLGFSFVPKSDLTVTHFRHYAGTKVSLWTDAGLLLASETVNSTPGFWLETPLTSPLRLLAGTTYILAYYTGGLDYFYRTEPDTDFADVTLLSGRFQGGDQFASQELATPGWAVDLGYVVGDVFVPVGVTLSNSGNFVGGRWSGQIAVRSPGTNITLRAFDAIGHPGSSAAFDVFAAVDTDGDGMWDGWEARYLLNPQDASDARLDDDGDGHSNLEEFLAGTAPNNPQSITRILGIDAPAGTVRLSVRGARGRSCLLERMDPATETWSTVLSFRIDSAAPTEDEVEIQDSVPATGSVLFYRIRVVPR